MNVFWMFLTMNVLWKKNKVENIYEKKRRAHERLINKSLFIFFKMISRVCVRQWCKTNESIKIYNWMCFSCFSFIDISIYIRSILCLTLFNYLRMTCPFILISFSSTFYPLCYPFIFLSSPFFTLFSFFSLSLSFFLFFWLFSHSLLFL